MTPPPPAGSTGRPADTPVDTPGGTSAEGPGPLIAAQELLEQPGPRTLLDIRWQLGRTDGHAEYRAGHLPGAVYVDLPTDLAGPPGAGGRHPLPDSEAFAVAMRRAGVHADVPVVVYDDAGGTSAARAWWLLRYHGHADVRVLDGGLRAWREAGGQLEAGEVTPPRGDFVPAVGQMPVVAADEVLGLVESGRVVDARAPERFRGDQEPVDPVAGHIPGAVNVPTAANLDSRTGRFRHPAELASAYREVRSASGPVAVYCGSGVTATHDVLALELLGVRAALYPGSWSEWVTDPSRPVATGPS